MDHPRHQFIADAALSEHGSAVEQRLSEYAERIEPADLEALMDRMMRDIFERVMDRVEADSGTIWLLDRDRTKLVVNYSHHLPELMRFEQPLDEGLISLVIAAEQAICENRVYAREEHSKRVDEAMGKTTGAMIAVPFYLGGSLRGVLSCVRWKTAGVIDVESTAIAEERGFSAANLNQVQLLSRGIERMLNYQLLKVILDLHV